MRRTSRIEGHVPGRYWRSRVALLTFALALSTSAFPADTRPELEFQPATVSLPGGIGQQATMLIVLRNPTDATLRNLRLSWLPRPNLDVQPSASLSVPMLAPHADHVWTLAIQPARALPPSAAPGPTAMARPGGPEAGAFTAVAPPSGRHETQLDENLDLRLDYELVTAGRTSPQVILKSLPVKTQDLGDLDKILDVQIKATLETLDSSQWGAIYLLLKNNSASTIHVLDITPIGKGVSSCHDVRTAIPYGSLPFCFYSSVHSLIIPPHQIAIEEFPVKASPRVRAGKYLLAFQILAQSSEAGAPIRRNIIVSQPVDVNVLGEPAILTVAGIPAFLLLPGMLLLLSIGLCWSLEERWWPAPDLESFPFRFTQPNFWLVSVILSLLIAIATWLLRGRWYFTRYRLEDIGLLWFASILAGIVCYGVWWLCRNHRRLQEAERMRMLADAEAAQLRLRSRS